MFIGKARYTLFVAEPNEWNGLVREITAAMEVEEQVDMKGVCDVLMRLYRRRATVALFEIGRE